MSISIDELTARLQDTVEFMKALRNEDDPEIARALIADKRKQLDEEKRQLAKDEIALQGKMRRLNEP